MKYLILLMLLTGCAYQSDFDRYASEVNKRMEELETKVDRNFANIENYLTCVHYNGITLSHYKGEPMVIYTSFGAAYILSKDGDKLVLVPVDQNLKKRVISREDPEWDNPTLFTTGDCYQYLK